MGCGVKHVAQDQAGQEQGPNHVEPYGHIKDFELHPEVKGEPWNSFEQETDRNQICIFSLLSIPSSSPQDLGAA